jgi:hypothetical protein
MTRVERSGLEAPPWFAELGKHRALQHGVPVVVAGDSEDKVETSARLAWSGAGIRLRTSTPTVAQVRRRQAAGVA